MQQQSATTEGKVGWRVNEWAAAAGVSRSTTYELIDEGRILSVKCGAARIITTSPREFLTALADKAA